MNAYLDKDGSRVQRDSTMIFLHGSCVSLCIPQLFLAITAIFLSSLSAGQSIDRSRIVVFDVPDFYQTMATGINNNGVITGRSFAVTPRGCSEKRFLRKNRSYSCRADCAGGADGFR